MSNYYRSELEISLMLQRLKRISIDARIEMVQAMNFTVSLRSRHSGARVGDIHHTRQETRIAIAAPRGRYRYAPCIILPRF
jgi:hypothetical protein